MATTTQNPDGSITLADDSGKTANFRNAPTAGAPGWFSVELYDPATGNALGTPARFKMSDSGGRVGADFPGVSGDLFIVDDSGSITND